VESRELDVGDQNTEAESEETSPSVQEEAYNAYVENSRHIFPGTQHQPQRVDLERIEQFGTVYVVRLKSLKVTVGKMSRNIEQALLYEVDSDDEHLSKVPVKEGDVFWHIDFMPHGKVQKDNRGPEMETLLMGINDLLTIVDMVERNDIPKPRIIFGLTNPNMARIAARRLGFKVCDLEGNTPTGKDLIEAEKKIESLKELLENLEKEMVKLVADHERGDYKTYDDLDTRWKQIESESERAEEELWSKRFWVWADYEDIKKREPDLRKNMRTLEERLSAS
jgi:hypothetical protein